jgi:2-keto-3-deoxy-6-phosphogluconate aldolase
MEIRIIKQLYKQIYIGTGTIRDTETGDPARLPAHVAERWELIK